MSEMAEAPREPKIGDSMYYTDSDGVEQSDEITEINNDYGDGSWDVAGEEGDYDIKWSEKNERWEAEEEE